MSNDSPIPLPVPVSPIDATAPSPRVSDRYRFISTREYITAFEAEGWLVGETSFVKSHKRDPQYAKHMITLFRDDVAMDRAQNLGGLTPRIHLLNSHDGSSRLSIVLGILRLVCTNGLMVSSGEIAQVSFRHDRSARETADVISTVFRSDAFAQIEKVGAWDSIELSPERQIEFATRARDLRFGEGSTVDPTSLLEARRGSDQGSSLWRTFNRIQENTMQGGIRFNGMRRRSRAVTNIDKNVALNRGLWAIAEEYASA